jgi:class 3 adenylate cyclase
MLWPPPFLDPAGGQVRALGQLAAADWQTFTENFSHMSVGWEEGVDARQLARSMRDSITQDMYFRWMRGAWGQWPGQPGYRELLDEYTRIEAPTLIMQRTPSASNPAIADLAAAIPEARVRIFEGEETVPTIGNVGDVVDAMSEFVGIPGTTKSAAQAAPGLRFATILFTDLVGHTELMRKLGDERGRQLLREHERITRAALSVHGGTEIKTDGDSFMASFTSATSAVECAISLQRSFAGMPDGPLRVRMGMNAGEPVEDDGDLFGSSVILAARVKDQAGAGEILVPEPVRHLLSGKGFDFADRGEFVPKGFDEPLRLFEVRWRE